MLQAFYIFSAVALFGLFFGERIKSIIGRIAPRQVVTWDYVMQASWGFVGWFVLYALTAGLLRDNLFPSQSTYIFSGDPVSLVPALGWGALIAWLVSGKPESSGASGEASTVDERIATLGRCIWIAVRLFGWGAAILVFGLAIFLFGTWLDTALNTMPTSRAILTGSVIIAAAIYFGIKARKA